MSAADVCRSEWSVEDLTSLRSQDPAVANSVRGRELWRLKLRSKKHVGIRRWWLAGGMVQRPCRGCALKHQSLGAPGLPLAWAYGHVFCGGLQTRPAAGKGLGVVGEGGGVGPSRDKR